jgi:hypothetical protein
MELLYIYSDVKDAELKLDVKRDGLVLRQTLKPKASGAQLIVPQTKNPAVTVKLVGPAEKTKNVFVRLYSNGSLEGSVLKGFTERIEARSSADGRISCILPEGLWWVEVAGRFKKVALRAGQSQVLSIEL